MKTELGIIIASIISIGLNILAMGPSIMNIIDGYNLKMSYALLCTNISLIIIAVILSYVAVLKNNK